MKELKLHEVKAQLSELIEQVSGGEEIIIFRYGKPVAKLTGLGRLQRTLGFYPIHFESDLTAPTDDETVGTLPFTAVRCAICSIPTPLLGRWAIRLGSALKHARD